MGCMANGFGKEIYRAMVDECETLLPAIAKLGLILDAGWSFRTFLNFVLKNIMNNGRTFRVLKNLREMNPKEFEAFLKHRYDFVYKIAQDNP